MQTQTEMAQQLLRDFGVRALDESDLLQRKARIFINTANAIQKTDAVRKTWRPR